MNGTIDAPEAPIAEQMPMALTCIDLGSSRERHIITHGNSGPRKKPPRQMIISARSCHAREEESLDVTDPKTPHIRRKIQNLV